MKRMNFGSDGRLLSVDSRLVDYESSEENSESSVELKTSKSLKFLRENKFEEIKDNSYWGLYDKGIKLKPLEFSNGKTQEDVVKEIVEAIKSGEKVIFLHGVCGTGKSAIALNVARSIGRASIVVPIKSLQKQYEEDYLGEKYLLKQNGKVMKIAMITGRENHDSVILPGVSCADPFLPETIKITEKNYPKLISYYKENPFIRSKEIPDLEDVKRISVAPSNPYWSPIVPALYELNQLKDAKKKKYLGLNDREFVFYHRKEGCSYYDQYLAYLDADVIIFNSAKYKIESAIGRKPSTDVEIFDEADEFLDNLSEQVEINLDFLSSSLKTLQIDSYAVKEIISKINELIELEQKNKRALGVREDEIYPIEETKIAKILSFFKDSELEAEISLDELNYANKALEAYKMIEGQVKDIYVTFKKKENNLFVTLVTTNLSGKLKEIIEKNKAVIFMSGTLHNEKVLKNIFGINNFKLIEAETTNQGSIEIQKTGKEFDCRYSNFYSGNKTREDYLRALSVCVEKSKKPLLVQINAFEDLPSEEEIKNYGLYNLIAKEKLISLQREDKNGKNISDFKSGKSSVLFTTKCSRGIDFPGEICNSVIFTKYPNPNIQGTFWKILKKTHQEHFWDFYKDKAKREFLQRIYRAVRSRNDHVYVLSPDSRVLDAVKELQKEFGQI